MELAKEGEDIIQQGGANAANIAAMASWKPTAPFGSGGAPRAMTLDLTNEKDRAMVRNAAVRRPARWRTVDEGFKDLMAQQLVLAVGDAKEIQDPFQRASVRTSITRTGALLVGQNQADDQINDENERLDSGKASGRVEVKFVNRMGGDDAPS
jgi:hypothetical protein